MGGRLGKRSTESIPAILEIPAITLTEWERLIKSMLETEVSRPNHFQVLDAFGQDHGRPSRGLFRLTKRANEGEEPEEHKLNEVPNEESEECKEA